MHGSHAHGFGSSSPSGASRLISINVPYRHRPHPAVDRKGWNMRRQETKNAIALALGMAAAGGIPPAAAWDLPQLGGSLAHGRFARYVPPLSNPLFNETPYITTELRAIYLHNEIPDAFLTGGGDIDVGAAEIRIALSERLGFIASKDGYADIDFKRTLPDERGFANISLGFKYALVERPEDEGIFTVGIEYEPPSGDLETAGIDLQGHGDGFVDLFMSGAATAGRWGFQASAGLNLAVDGRHDSSMLHYAAHVDYELFPGFYPVLELNGFTVVDRGTRTPLDFEGIDLVNFGSTAAGTVIAAAVGARYRLAKWLLLGVGYERPLTDREDLLDWRVYTDLIVHF